MLQPVEFSVPFYWEPCDWYQLKYNHALENCKDTFRVLNRLYEPVKFSVPPFWALSYNWSCDACVTCVPWGQRLTEWKSLGENRGHLTHHGDADRNYSVFVTDNRIEIRNRLIVGESSLPIRALTVPFRPLIDPNFFPICLCFNADSETSRFCSIPKLENFLNHKAKIIFEIAWHF